MEIFLQAAYMSEVPVLLKNTFRCSTMEYEVKGLDIKLRRVKLQAVNNGLELVYKTETISDLDNSEKYGEKQIHDLRYRGHW